MIATTSVLYLHLGPSRSDLIEFNKLTRSNATHNLQQAFNVAEQHLGLTKLLDPEGENVQLALLISSDTTSNTMISVLSPK